MKKNSPDTPMNDGISRRGFLGAAAGTAAATMLGVPATAHAQAPADRQYRIHPAIGVARVGNADPATFFIGPEAPGYEPFGDAPGTAPYPRKVGGLIKPQGARFRIFEYIRVGGVWQMSREVNLSNADVTGIQWTAQLANRKASFNKFGGPTGETTAPLGLRNASVADRATLEIDFGPRTISGASTPPVLFQLAGSGVTKYPKKPNGAAVIDYLGQIRTDAAGRLIVIGGKGKADYNTATQPALSTYANNDNWFDDISDGPVNATITVKIDGIDTAFSAIGAWCLVAPPDFAPQIANTVTMYDLLYDVAVRSLPIPASNALYMSGGPLYRIAQLKAAYHPGQPVEFPGIVPDFDREIKPILLTGYNYYWVDSLVPTRHSSLIDPNLGNTSPAYNSSRQFMLGYMRPPVGLTGPSGKKSMPHILGDDAYNSRAPLAVQNLAVTHTQYGLLTNWATGAFVGAGTGIDPALPVTPWGLDRAALENCVGGAFYPGIEASWQIRNPALYLEPFRINQAATSQYLGESGQPIRAGHFSRQMAVPWHADFNDCRAESTNAWWPGQRPDSVYVPSNGQRIDWARPDGAKFASGSKTSTHADMVTNWSKFGFVVSNGTAYVETERTPGIQ